MAVTTRHPEYNENLALWRMIDAALEGEHVIKGNASNLPKPAGMIAAEMMDSRNATLYKSYTERAQYEHWVSDSLRSMMGLVSRLQPEIVLPKALSYLENNATDDGFGLHRLFMRVVRQAITHGRAPILVNVDDSGQPYFTVYKAESAINWIEESVRGRRDLQTVVFAETRRDTSEDKFSHDVITVYRVIELVDGACITYVTDGEGTVIEEPITLGRAGSGRMVSALNYVPVVYAGSTDNSPDVDELPLLTMAKSALKSYQLSADYFTALHQTSHPQPWVSGLDDSSQLTVTGPSAAWDLGPTGSCGYLEFQGAGIEAVRQAMSDQKNMALEAGAKVMDVSGMESGDARRARQDDQHATLHSIVITAAKSIEQVLKMAADWLGYDANEVSFKVNPEFGIKNIDPQILAQIKEAVVAGGLSWDSFWNYLTTGKIPERMYDDERDLVAEQGPILGLA